MANFERITCDYAGCQERYAYKRWGFNLCSKHLYAGEEQEPVDPIDQICIMLPWHEEYTDEFKRKCLIDAIEWVLKRKGEGHGR